MQIKQQIQQQLEGLDTPAQIAYIEDLRAFLHSLSPQNSQPVNYVRWVPIEKVHANDYNPNSVAKNEMRLLYVSILHDGYTQPVVTVYDQEKDKYVIVDGFHRYYTCKTNKDIFDRNKVPTCTNGVTMAALSPPETQ